MKTRAPSIDKPSRVLVSGLLQRKCACGGSSGLSGCQEHSQRKPGLQRHSANASRDVPPIVHDVLRSSGQPLDNETRALMEPRFGHDFSRVRVFADERAGASARAVQSLAFTVGNNLVFDSGQYSPRTTAGKRLIAHELTHVVQQAQGATAMQSSLTIGHPHDRYEQEADRMAQSITEISAGEQPDSSGISALPGNQIQRACASCAEEEEEEKKPEHKGFTYEDLMAGEVKEEEETLAGQAGTPQKKPLTANPKSTTPGNRSPGREAPQLPHFVSATIKCESGDYVVKLNDWAGKPCGISDCVTVHESSHIDDWRVRWPKGCKKADGTNQPDGFLPTGWRWIRRVSEEVRVHGSYQGSGVR